MSISTVANPSMTLSESSTKPTDHSPLQSYTEPTTGNLSGLPLTWRPYAQLMRIDRPAGLYAIYFPYLIGLIYAACISPIHYDLDTIFRLAVLQLPLIILLRGIACTWNDIADQDLDRQVSRCRNRPIARGAVSTPAAFVFVICQTVVGGVYLTRFFPCACVPHMLLITLLSFIYPSMKRITNYPQAFLGLPIAWAVFFSVAYLNIDPFETIYAAPSMALFGSVHLWTVSYDTVYAHQDVADDAHAGVKSMAVRFRESTKVVTALLSVGQVGLLVGVGLWADFGAPYYVGTVGGVAAAMGIFIWSVDLGSPARCGAWFKRQFWLVGAGYVAGLFLEHVLKATET
jgi:4-hydroxybenzoate polyprenyltransferase